MYFFVCLFVCLRDYSKMFLYELGLTKGPSKEIWGKIKTILWIHKMKSHVSNFPIFVDFGVCREDYCKIIKSSI